MRFIPRISSFSYLNCTQFLVTLNDSIFRLIITYSLIDLLGEQESNKILAISASLFVLPFLVFAQPSGQLADRFSKRNMVLVTSWAELIFMFYGYFAIWIQDVFSCYTALFGVALQSAVFNPVKYSIIPELEPRERIARVNGFMTLFTYLAILIGTFLASFISDLTSRNYLFVVFICIIFSILAIFTSYGIEKTPVKDPTKKINPLFIVDIYRTLKIGAKFPYLLLSIFASSYFLFTAAFTQLNLIPFGMQSLGITDVQTGYVYLAAALGLGVGSLLVGIFSGKGVELGLSIWGAWGTGLSYIALFVFQHSLFLSCLMFFSVGMHGGLYVVPLDAYVQYASPDKVRGSMVAAGTFMSFAAVLLSAGVLALFGEVFHLKAATGYFIMGWFTVIVATIILLRLPEFLTRLIAVLIMKTFFVIHLREPPEKAILVCKRRAFLTVFPLVYSFQRIRFVKWCKGSPLICSTLFYKLFHKVPVGITEKGELSDKSIEYLRQIAEENVSLVAFTEDKQLHKVGIDAEKCLYLLKQATGLSIQDTQIEHNIGERSGFFHFFKVLKSSLNISFSDSSSITSE